MADVSVNIFGAVRNREGVSTPVSGVIVGDPLPNPVNPPNGTVDGGIGVTINGKNIGGVKIYILTTETVKIPQYWQYNIVGDLTVDGTIDLDGEINLI